MTTAIDSRIDAVTVFTRGASVTRVATLSSDQGRFPERVRLAGLPLALDDSSVRVRVAAEDGDAPLATDVAVELEAPNADDDTRAPSDEALDAARTTVEKAEALVRRLHTRKNQIKKVQVAARPTPEVGHAPITSPRASRFALVELREQVVAELDAELFAATDALEDAQEALALIEDQRRRATTEREARPHELRKTVVLTFAEGSTAKTAQVFVEYRVPGARWAPSYVLRLDRTLTDAELAVSALVRQNTGEDWSNVRLRLSTAAWQQWVELPKLESLRVGRAQPRREPRWRPAPTGTGALFADFDRVFGGAPPPEPIEDFDDDTAAELFAREEPLHDVFEEPTRSRPVMQRAIADKSLDASRGVGGFAEGAVTADLEMCAAPPPAAASRSMMSIGFGGGMPKKRAGAAPRRPRPVEPEIVMSRRLLDYGSLYLAGIDEQRRGELVHEDRFDRYRRVLIAQRLSVQFELVQAIEVAERSAESVELGAPAPRHVFAQRHDGFDYAYDAMGRNDVPSDGRDQSVPLALRSAQAAPKYVVVPRASRDVFREVHLENPLAAPLLAGPVDVYVDDAYLSTVDLATTAARGEVQIGLGVEQAIKVSRNVHFAEHTTGLIRGSRDLAHQVRIELRNHLPRTATLEVRERLPAAQERDDDVRVTVDRVAPEWAAYEPKDALLRGGHRWNVDVAPGGERTLQLDYTIRIKAGEELVGGNNREI